MFFSHSFVLFLCVPSFGTCAQSQTCRTVADPDLLIRGGGGGGGKGGGHQDHEIRGEAACLKKKFFQPFGPQFGLKIRWGAPPLDSPP